LHQELQLLPQTSTSAWSILEDRFQTSPWRCIRPSDRIHNSCQCDSCQQHFSDYPPDQCKTRCESLSDIDNAHTTRIPHIMEASSFVPQTDGEIEQSLISSLNRDQDQPRITYAALGFFDKMHQCFVAL
jgi:hypothetical protein